MIDLLGAPVVDVHCHPWRNEDLLALDAGGFEDRITMMGMCQITSGIADERVGSHVRELTRSTPLALAMRRRLAAWLGCAPSESTVASERHARLAADPPGYNRALLEDANVVGLVYDEGYPQPTISKGAFAAACGGVVHRVGRIEPWISALRTQVDSYSELADAFRAELDGAAGDSAMVAYKSVIAYRTGLDVENPSPDECERAFQRWRKSGFSETREDAKPIRDALIRETLAAAKRHERVVHIHCGGGDPQVVLTHARPQDLFPLLSEYSDQPIVLIHAGWPWVEEAAYIASILPHVHLDVSVMMPWASLAVDQKLEVILGTAPPAKVMYGSDEASEPEVIWLSAQLAREALSRVLGTAVDRRWLDEREARQIGEGVLARNSRHLHSL